MKKRELLDILEKEYDLYEKIYTLSRKKVDALVKNNTDLLQQIISEMKPLLENLRSEEMRRTALISRIAKQRQVPEKEISLTRLSEWWECPDLLVYKDKLRAVMGKVEKTNQRCTALIDQANKICSELRDMLYWSLQTSSGYDHYGKLEKRQRSYFEHEA